VAAGDLLGQPEVLADDGEPLDGEFAVGQVVDRPLGVRVAVEGRHRASCTVLLEDGHRSSFWSFVGGRFLSRPCSGGVRRAYRVSGNGVPDRRYPAR
jgi:hypothetical protein